MNHKGIQGTKVTFYRIKDNASKLHLISFIADQAYRQEKKLLILTPNQEASQYIDALLWRLPEESFLPHQVVQTQIQEWIAITTLMDHNLNQASWLLNLTLRTSPLQLKFTEIFELYDETHPSKMEGAQQKLLYYQNQNFTTALEEWGVS